MSEFDFHVKSLAEKIQGLSVLLNSSSFLYRTFDLMARRSKVKNNQTASSTSPSHVLLGFSQFLFRHPLV